jgi:hypothetical protein
MLRAAIIQLGKIGLSYQSMVNVLPALRSISVCDTTDNVLDAIATYTGVNTYSTGPIRRLCWHCG